MGPCSSGLPGGGAAWKGLSVPEGPLDARRGDATTDRTTCRPRADNRIAVKIDGST